MRDARPRYMCFPSVVCVGEKTKITVFPRDISRIFRVESKYELCVMGLFEVQLYHRAPLVYDHPFSIENGCLTFEHIFDREQEYSIRILDSDGKEISVPMYAVSSDLYHLRPLKGDLHTHTYYSDGQDGIAMTPSSYREEGFDFVSITDHNRRYPSELAADLYEGIPLGLHIMKGEEIHTPGSMLHIVHVGGTGSVCSRYLEQPELYEQEVTQIENRLTYVPETYRRLTAMAKWACEKIHEVGGLAIFPHPFWCPKRYNVTKEFCDILFAEKIFDAFEIVGGAKWKGNNLQLALWQEQAFGGNLLPVVGSSDSHNHDFDKTNFGRLFTVVFAKDNTTENILDAIRNGYSVAGEIPHEQNNEVRFYGAKLRLVAFAHFLYENYFSETRRLCCCEGILMRRYAEGEPVAELLASLSDTIETFYKKFYGMLPAPAVTAEHQQFLDKAREIQITKGPETTGIFLQRTAKNKRRE